jgi:hypothetical protein
MQLTYQKRIQTVWEATRAYFLRLSLREQIAVVIAVTFVLIFGIVKISLPIKEHFVTQTARLEQLRSDLAAVPQVFRQYFRLISTKRQIEERYQQVRRTEGVLSHLERIVREKTQLSQGLFTISELPVQSFGGSYENHAFSVRLRSVGVKETVDLLNEVVNGDEPYLLTRLEIDRRYRSDKLEVTLEVSSISPKQVK